MCWRSYTQAPNRSGGSRLPRRDEILQYVADEVVRQMAPGHHTNIDPATGQILVLPSSSASQGSPPRGTNPPDRRPTRAAARTSNAAWYWRLRDLRMKFGLALLLISLALTAAAWFTTRILSINPGKGTPIGQSVRTASHIATLIKTLEPYVPSLHRDASKDRYSVSLFVVPVDGSEPWLVLLRSGLTPVRFALAKVLGGDGKRVWFDLGETGTVDLSSREVRASDGPVPRGSRARRPRPFR